MFEVEYSSKAKKFLKSLDKHILIRILERIEKLKENSVPSDAKFIGREAGEKIFRYRIGEFRALYQLKESDKTVLIIKIDKRPRVYD